MSDFILLLQKGRCPSCGVRRSFISGNCHNCGVRLFTSDCDTDFEKFEEGTGIVHWFAYNRDKGWIHRDHYMIEGAAPLVKRYELPEIPKDYGTKETPDDVRAKKAQVVRHVKKEKSKVKLPKSLSKPLGSQLS